MRWKGGRRSGNVQDRRGVPMKGIVGGGLGTVVLVIAALVLGVDPSAILSGGGGPVATGPGAAPPGADSRGTTAAPEDELGAFADVVLAQTEDTWSPLFQQAGATYREPTLVLFDNAVQSACGTASSAVGPFYCPRDGQVYLDLSFFQQLRALGAPGDFAQAYVIAHEVGHHVQNLTGDMGEFTGYGAAGPSSAAVRLELQADCYAGIWGSYVQRQGLLEAGDFEEGLLVASAIGDDNLQRQTQGHVAPESFTHGTSEQRSRWFRRGFESGDPQACDTSGRL
jgi:predicted metalloprotease